MDHCYTANTWNLFYTGLVHNVEANYNPYRDGTDFRIEKS